jgi:hypothetical protein
MCRSFAQMAARFEDEYIFCWLEWDGDNILMDGSIIDYGSIRQFGMYHDEYRYDDVEKYSTTIKEQKYKAKYMVQTFVQAVDYLITKEKKNIKEFTKSDVLKQFDRIYNESKNRNLLIKLGLKPEWVDLILKSNNKYVESFRKTFSYFETAKSEEGLYEVPDGITRNAIFCMRDILRELPQIYLSRGVDIDKQEFLNILKSSYATEDDVKINSYRSKKISDFQKLYWKIVDITSEITNICKTKILLEMTMRSSIINKYDRVTGDSVSKIVELVLKNKKKLGVDGVYQLLEDIVDYQNIDPKTRKRSKHHPRENKLLREVFEIVHYYRESL